MLLTSCWFQWILLISEISKPVFFPVVHSAVVSGFETQATGPPPAFDFADAHQKFIGMSDEVSTEKNEVNDGPENDDFSEMVVA